MNILLARTKLEEFAQHLKIVPRNWKNPNNPGRIPETKLSNHPGNPFPGPKSLPEFPGIPIILDVVRQHYLEESPN